MTERVDGEVREDLGGDVDEDKAAGARKKAPRPSECGAYSRAQLAKWLPVILDAFLDKAGNGSLSHLRLVLALIALDERKIAPKRPGKEKNLEAVFLERWAQDRMEREQAEAGRHNSQETADREAE